ncbi:hypothetical protein AB1Y20_013390 [Prymnesium parvum]|uniref:Tim44-like domain-containing protein n=1 Tax=Prymnesium parvum TaxID=97485 RepID=A0AB34IIY7_PRYPA
MRIAAARRAWTAAALPRSLARAPRRDGARASMCTVPDTVPHWGGLGRTEEEINGMAAELRANYLKRVDTEAGLHAYVARTQNYLANPRYWFGGSTEKLEELLREYEAKLKETISSEHAALLDGIEDAYRAVVDEFTSEEPDFDRFVENGAMGEECAELLSEILSVWTDEGLRPVIDIDHVKTEIVSLRYGHANGRSGMNLTVLITSREAHRTVPAASAAAGARAKETATATAEAKSEAKHEYRDVSQLWHLTAEITPEQMLVSMARKRTEPFVPSNPEWELTDINFICFRMEVPAEPPEPEEMFKETMVQMISATLVMATITYAIYRAAKSSKLSTPPELRKPLAKEREGVQKTESNEETVPRNQWGDAS